MEWGIEIKNSQEWLVKREEQRVKRGRWQISDCGFGIADRERCQESSRVVKNGQQLTDIAKHCQAWLACVRHL